MSLSSASSFAKEIEQTKKQTHWEKYKTYYMVGGVCLVIVGVAAVIIMMRYNFYFLTIGLRADKSMII